MDRDFLALIFSDLHLGEEDSVFMLYDKDEVNSTYLEALKAFLSERVELPVPYLIIAGDGLDLSLARRRKAFPALKAFLSKFNDLFSEVLIYLPGNHDHHLWVALQEEALIFQKIRTNREVEPYYYALCPLIESGQIRFPRKEISQPFGQKTFLYHLLPEEAQAEGRGFLVAYPNLYLKEDDSFILVTHGHFFEEVWTLFSDVLRGSLAQMGLKRLNFKKLEQINSPFIEFGWYSLGQAGELSMLLERLWDELHAGGPGPLTDKVLEDIIHYLDERLDFKPKARKTFFGRIQNIFRHLWAGAAEVSSDALLWLTGEIIKHLLMAHIVEEGKPKPGASLRHSPSILSDEKTRVRIKTYLEMALPAFPALNKLIFGHTHVPFLNGELEIDTPAGKRKIVCFNTGGWVTDVYDADHLTTSRPFVLGIKVGGEIESFDIPWPSYEEFESIEGLERDKARKRTKKLIWKKLVD